MTTAFAWMLAVPPVPAPGTAQMRTLLWRCATCGKLRAYDHGEVFNPPPCEPGHEVTLTTRAEVQRAAR